jgi:hypothetical protein
MRGNYRVGRVEIRDGSTSILVEQDYAQESTMDRQPAVVIDKAKLPELLHEMIDSRPGCADPWRQAFLIDTGMYSLGPALLATMSQQEENPSQTLLAGIEKLIDEILPNAFDAFPGPFSTLFLTCNFKDLNLSRRVRSAVLVGLAVPRGLRALPARAETSQRLPVPKTRSDHLVKRP